MLSDTPVELPPLTPPERLPPLITEPVELPPLTPPDELPPLITEPVRLPPLTPPAVLPPPGQAIENAVDVFSLIYEQATGAALVAVGSRRPDAHGQESPHWLVPIPLTELRTMLPGVFEYEPEHTQYAAVRATFKTGALLGKGQDAFAAALSHGRPLYFAVQKKHVLELVAVAVDLDVGRPGLPSAEQALGDALHRARRGLIPWPHLGAFSGRGLYLLWLLTDDERTHAIKATDASISTFKHVTGELCGRLSGLAPDTRLSKNVAGWLKRPGTIDTKTGRQVVYMRLGSAGVIPKRYTLSEMAAALRVELPQAALENGHRLNAGESDRHQDGRSRYVQELNKHTEPVEPAPSSRRRSGTAQAYDIHLDLVDLLNWRGTIQQGMRHEFLFTWLRALRIMGFTEIDARMNAWSLVQRRRIARGDSLIHWRDIELLTRRQPPPPGATDTERAKLRHGTWAHATLDRLAESLAVTPPEMRSLRQVISMAERARRTAERQRTTAERRAHYERARQEVARLLRENAGAGDERVADEVSRISGGACSRGLVAIVRRELGIAPNRRGNYTKRPRR